MHPYPHQRAWWYSYLNILLASESPEIKSPFRCQAERAFV
jgi:hypothetical protein